MGSELDTWHKIRDIVRYTKKYFSSSQSNKTTYVNKRKETGKHHLTQENVNNNKNKRRTAKTNNRVDYSKKEKQLNGVLKTAEEIKQLALIETTGPACPYCGSISEIKTAKEYTGNEADYCYWVCPQCINVSVTTSPKTYFPSGNLGDAETRRFRSEVQRLLSDKKEELNQDRFALNQWIQETLKVDAEQAWVGRLTKIQLATLARNSQKEIFEKRYGYIYRKIEK